MPSPDPLDVSIRHLEALDTAVRRDLGHRAPTGTTVVGSTEREGSTTAVVYPLGDRTIIWCAPTIADRLTALNQPIALGGEDVVAAAEPLGGSFVGAGNHRVLRRPPAVDEVAGYRVLALDRDVATDRALLADFVAACPVDDLDEAELALDDLDPSIIALVDTGGAIASYASARPWTFDPAFDDIAVITRPDRRGLGLGAAVVGEFARRRLADDRLLFYGCDVENAGSNAIAERVGFDLVCTVTAIDVAT